MTAMLGLRKKRGCKGKLSALHDGNEVAGKKEKMSDGPRAAKTTT